MRKIISKSAAETQKIAADLVKKLSARGGSAFGGKGGEILALTGDLGGGKTTFVQGLAKGFGIKKQITSPSFVLIKEYPLKNKQAKDLVHIDLYRLKKVDKIFKREILEYFKPENIVVIEWAEKIKNALPKNTQWIEFDFIDENTRKIVFK